MSARATEMRFYSAASRATRSDEAAREMAEALRFRLGGPADLALLCFSPEHAAGLEAMADRICDRLGTEQLLGMQASALISGGFEIEEARPPACSPRVCPGPSWSASSWPTRTGGPPWTIWRRCANERRLRTLACC